MKKNARILPIEWVNPRSLRPAPFNPPIRTEDEKLVELLESMRKHGFLAYPEPLRFRAFLLRPAPQLCE